MRTSALFILVGITAMLVAFMPASVSAQQATPQVAQDVPKDAVPAVATTPPAPPPKTFDPKMLIREWEGQWKSSLANTSDKAYVTIKEISGDDVVAITHAAGRQRYHNRDLDSKGKLTFDKDGVPTIHLDAGRGLTYTLRLVSPNKLEGKAQADGFIADLELNAKK
ncbi:MAG: hypothetical protein HYT40_02900 [Candidatus Sungbacteria bacterium]|uniref:Uncharacterized protein n=1 Tax=Candidatus Sungiibacteriota bacterium TaxID=2750080 RepID=A0A931SDN3_9BACT|nr:hypothetical protein [Candidatus Sungbacteria bacterium]